MESYTTKIKNELTELKLSLLEETVLLSAFIRNNGFKDQSKIILTIENTNVMKYVENLIKNIFDVNVEVIKLNNYKKKSVYNLIINDKINQIYDTLMIYKNGIYINKPEEYFVDSDDLKKAYLRGLFLASGSINDPKTASYHLELVVSLAYESEFAIDLLKFYNIQSKVIDRDKGYMVYVKESEKISDFLKVIGASRAVMYYEEIRIYRDSKNMTNRLNNCEQANVDKMIMSSESQINDINLLIQTLGYDLIDDKLKDVITYRLKYPEVSLIELANIMSKKTNKKITKSGVNHRLRKIKELAKKIRKN